MKLELFTDIGTGRVFGYNKIINDDVIDKDRIFIEGEEAEKFMKIGIRPNLYYIDGKIQLIEPKTNEVTEESDSDWEDDSNDMVAEQLSKYRELVKDEHKIFMDNIIAGMSMEEAREQTKFNRNKLEELEKISKKQEKQKEIDVENLYQERFKKEESKIDYKYYVSILLLIRDENEYLEEWLKYAFETVGIDHVYLYDNESTVPVRKYLQERGNPYLPKMTFIKFMSTDNTQQDANNHFLQKYGNETRWIAPMDTDEFIVMNDKSKTLKSFLKENEDHYASILCQWRHYGANGQVEKKPGGVLERFTKPSEFYDWPNSGKRFIQTNRCNQFYRYNPILRRRAHEMNDDANNTKIFQLNHYFTRSYEEWVEKITKRGSCDPTVLRNLKLFWALNPDMDYLKPDDEEDPKQIHGHNPLLEKKG